MLFSAISGTACFDVDLIGEGGDFVIRRVGFGNHIRRTRDGVERRDEAFVNVSGAFLRFHTGPSSLPNAADVCGRANGKNPPDERFARGSGLERAAWRILEKPGKKSEYLANREEAPNDGKHEDSEDYQSKENDEQPVARGARTFFPGMTLEKFCVPDIRAKKQGEGVASDRDGADHGIHKDVSSHPGEDDFRNAKLCRTGDDHGGNERADGVPDAWKKPDDGIDSKTNFRARNDERGIHDASDELAHGFTPTIPFIRRINPDGFVELNGLWVLFHIDRIARVALVTPLFSASETFFSPATPLRATKRWPTFNQTK